MGKGDWQVEIVVVVGVFVDDVDMFGGCLDVIGVIINVFVKEVLGVSGIFFY